MEKTKLFPFTLQFFGEGDDGANDDKSGADNGNGTDNTTPNQNGGDDNGGKAEKTFSQSEVNRMMTREKQQGKQSVLNSLGFKTEEEAKNAFNLLKALTDSQKTAEQKAEENKNTAIQEKASAEQRAIQAEAKLSCVMNGVNTEAVDDVLAIALTKVTDDKTLDDVLGEMKNEARYASFFTSTTENKGGKDNNNSSGGNTGRTPQNNNNAGGDSTDYGKQLAEKYGSKVGEQTKSKFF